MTIHMAVGAFCCLCHGKVHLALNRKVKERKPYWLPKLVKIDCPDCIKIMKEHGL